jgi:hypothetical protein
MTDVLFKKALIYAKRLQDISRTAFAYYIETNDRKFAEIALDTGMLICDICRQKGTTIIGKSIYCKDHKPS